MFFQIFLLFFSANEAFSAQISEDFLLSKSKDGSPSLDEIEAQFLFTKTKLQETNEEFSPELFAKGTRGETNERALITFQPIFTPTTQTQLGVKQNFKYGAAASMSFYTDERDSSSSPVAGNFRHATTMGMNLSLQLDLWKNLLGRLSESRVDILELETKKAEFQKEIQTKAFKIGLRKIYWSLVANEESLKISEGLLKTAKIQAEEAKRRFKNAVADADEVARYEAQVASRQSQILSLKYQRELVATRLRNLLPKAELNEDLELAPYDLEKTMGEVLNCTSTISEIKNIPFENTHYDEVVALIKKLKIENDDLNSRHSDVDVKFIGSVKATGVSSETSGPGQFRGSYGGAWDDINQTNRTGYEVGLLVNMPLGDAKEETKKTKDLYNERLFVSSIDKTQNQVINTHRELLKAIIYLNQVIQNQKITSRELNKRLQGMKKKYQQARVSVNELIMDQDALLNSDLSIIQTQLQVLNIIFDYLTVFTETPCGFNRI